MPPSLMNSAYLSWILHTVKMILPTLNDTAYVRKKKIRIADMVQNSNAYLQTSIFIYSWMPVW